MTMVSSASPNSHFPTNAEECGNPQQFTPEREAEIREWLDELGSRKDFPSVGPYTALLDSLAEIDRLRGRVTELEQELADYTEPDVDGAGRTYEEYHPQADDPARCLKAHAFFPRDGWRMICGNCDHGKDAACHQGGAS